MYTEYFCKVAWIIVPNFIRYFRYGNVGFQKKVFRLLQSVHIEVVAESHRKVFLEDSAEISLMQIKFICDDGGGQLFFIMVFQEL